MLSWKTFSLLVAAAVAMNGAAALEQGYGGGVKLPSATTATPSDASVVQETPSSVDASSAIDLSSASASAATSYPSKSDTALPSGSGSNDLYTGSAVQGSSAVEQGSDASTPGTTGVTASHTGSAVEGSSAIDQGSNSVPETFGSASGPADVTVGSQEQQGSYGTDLGNASKSAPGSTTGSNVAGSTAIETSASGSEPCEGSLSLAGSSVDADSSANQGSTTQDQGSDASTPTSEAGSEATTPTSSTGSGSTPTQTDASAATESSGSATFPSTGTSCKRRLRRN
ncbi:hypothetical protein PHYPSEUDO_014895 [Phytophthora pseudosyringae]|uniref:RxLR effector protein n=1 Tax=Phytophthora pseudosyringae TaxID=221518 RepID=A0A8T1V4F3_9STRA|nr:hypothetical protein PHYPSEUDO_014895 [Phytophthora pseudosyringae]